MVPPAGVWRAAVVNDFSRHHLQISIQKTDQSIIDGDIELLISAAHSSRVILEVGRVIWRIAGQMPINICSIDMEYI